MKRVISLLLVAMLAFSSCASNTTSSQPDTKDDKKTTVSGVFTGKGQGKGGDIVLELTLNNSVIENIVVTENHETMGYADTLVDMIDAAIEQNSVNPDVVTSASLTANGFKDALKEALQNAGLSENDLVKKSLDEKKERKQEELSVDVAVIGAGGAGLVSTIKAKETGANVVLFEKMAFAGGNTLISGAEMAAPNNWIQQERGIKDNPDNFYENLKVAGGKDDMIRTLADNALDAAIYLRDDIKVEWEDDIMFFGGHNVARSLIPNGHSGQELIKKLLAKANELQIPIYYNAKVTDLIVDESGRVTGFNAYGKNTDYVVKAKSVILASGGFGSNIEMRKKYNPEIDERFLSTNASGIQGDGIVMAEKVGANLIDMKEIQLYPVCDVISGALLYTGDTRLTSHTGAVFVNKEGKRFVEELDTRYKISMAILSQTDSVGYLLWDQDAAEKAQIEKNHKAEMDYLIQNNNLVIANTLDELADAYGIDKEQFKKTIETYNTYKDLGKDPEFNYRGELFKVEKAPFYLLKTAPAIHHTMGGVETNPKAQVLNKDGKVIEGLYAAGEVTGGIHGNNRLGSAAIADITVFGLIAGENAAKEALEK